MTDNFFDSPCRPEWVSGFADLNDRSSFETFNLKGLAVELIVATGRQALNRKPGTTFNARCRIAAERDGSIPRLEHLP